MLNIKMEELDTLGIPVITLHNAGKDLRFVIDSGSTTSAIDKNVMQDLEYVLLEEKQISIGVEGLPEECDVCFMTLTDDDGNEVNDVFTVLDLGASSVYIMDNYQMKIDGMIGTSMLINYKCLLDFVEKKMIAE